MKKTQRLIMSMVLIFTMLLSTTVWADTTYTVQEGDVLWKIAQDNDMDYQKLADYNNLENPNLIKVGQKLNIPDGDLTDTNEEKPDTVSESNIDITLLATSDLHGRIYPYEYAIDSEDSDAGIAKIQTLVKQQRAAHDNVILMDLGDTVQDNSAELFNDDPIHPMIAALNYMNYDTWTIGNHEFNFEKSFLEKNIDTFEGTVLSANTYKEDGTRLVDAYKIIEKDGVRVAVVGMLPPYINIWEASSPEHFEGLNFTPTVEEAKKVVAELEGKYDVLVGAFHLGFEGEHGYEGVEAVANACPEFDVIFMGHAHSKIDGDEVNGVKVIEPGAYGWALSKATVSVDKTDAGVSVVGVTTENIQTADVEADADMLKEFSYVHEKSIEDANTVIGTVSADFVDGVDYITGEETVTTMPTVQVEDTPLIDLINDVQLFYTGAEISSAAAFKNDMNLVAGDFKKKDVANIYKYSNTLMGVNITGANLKKYMEWSASYYNTYVPGDVTVSFDENIRGYNYDMFAGVDYDIDISKPAGSRITNLTMDGQAIDDDAVYKLAVNNYRFGTLLSLELVTEEDKYFDSYEVMQDAGRIRDLIIKYIQEEEEGVATPTVDNNWKIIGNTLDHPLKDEAMALVKDGTVSIPRSEDGRTPNVKSVNIYDLIDAGYFTDYDALTILHTNDMHGFFVEGDYDGMGAAKLATVVKAMRQQHPNTLLLDAGDATQGANLVTLSKGETAMTVMNALGYDAMAAGNHEFDYGKEQMLKNVGLAEFPVLAANIKDAEGKDVLTPYIIRDVNGIKVGIFGLATPETKYKSHPDNTTGLTFEDPKDVAKEMVELLDPQVDVIVALVHLGDEGDYTSISVAEAVDGIDVMLDGHSHSTYPYGMLVNDTLIASTGEKTKNLGVVELAFMDGKIVSKDAHLFTKAQSLSVEDDKDLTQVVTEIQEANAVIEDEVVATAPYDLQGEREFVRTGETNLGNLITAALLDISGADVALTNGGGIRASISAGEVTKGDVLTVLPFGNTVRVIEVTGEELKAAIENGIDSYPDAKGAFPHIAGMKVTFDSTQPAGSRVVSIEVGGEALDESKTYTLATNDFIVAGGDGYSMFVGNKVVGEYGAMDEVLIDYLNDKGFDASALTERIEDISMTTTYLEDEAA